MKVIDSHPYENVDDDGNPLGRRRGDDIQPDYETILVKNDTNSTLKTFLFHNSFLP